MNRPRSIPVYLATEVVEYVKDVKNADVTPYLTTLYKQSALAHNERLLRVSPATNNLKMMELKEAIYEQFGSDVFILYDLDEAGWEGEPI
jgi:hypothetical protein